jgi:predicted nucleotidyltransferase
MKPWLTDLVEGARQILPKGFHLYLFGSQAKGKAQVTSDVDIGVWGHEELPAGVMTRLEDLGDSLPTLDKMDWVDLGRVSGAFREHALKDSIRLV